MNGVLVLTAPPAVGHSTVAELLTRDGAAVVDGDDVRAMVRSSAAPGSGPEWDREYELCVRNLCAIAANIDRAGLPCLLLDVVEPEVVPLYRTLLAEVSRFDLVLLTADDRTLLARERDRDPHPVTDPAALVAWQQRIVALRDRLVANAHLYDHVIDTSLQSPEQTADAVHAALRRTDAR